MHMIQVFEHATNQIVQRQILLYLPRGTSTLVGVTTNERGRPGIPGQHPIDLERSLGTQLMMTVS